MIVVVAPTIATAWLDATSRLLDAGGDVFTSIVTVENPEAERPRDIRARALVDAFMVDYCNGKDTQAVASTIFPIAMIASRSPEKLYSDYITRTFPRIKRQPGNSRGTYFLRMIDYATVKGNRVVRVNQLDRVIRKMRRSLGGRGPMRSVYELSVYHAGEDAGSMRGFPCLSHVSLKLDTANERLHLTAVYRNQAYIERLYGNLLGLSRLQSFVAQQVGYGVGGLTCHATHADLGVADSNVRRVVESVRAVLSAGEVAAA